MKEDRKSQVTELLRKVASALHTRKAPKSGAVRYVVDAGALRKLASRGKTWTRSK